MKIKMAGVTSINVPAKMQPKRGMTIVVLMRSHGVILKEGIFVFLALFVSPSSNTLRINLNTLFIFVVFKGFVYKERRKVCKNIT